MIWSFLVADDEVFLYLPTIVTRGRECVGLALLLRKLIMV
jgi:hypothetical protein